MMLDEEDMPHRYLIDYDSTLAETFNTQLGMVNARFGTDYQPPMFNRWRSEDFIPKEHADYMWGGEVFMNPDFQATVPPVLGAIEGARALIDAGNKLWVISDRPDTLLDSTRAWLDINGLADIPLIFTRHRSSMRVDTHGAMTKSQASWAYRLTHVVEDAPHHALTLAKRKYIERVFLLNRPYNVDVPYHEKIVRCNNWSEITFHAGATTLIVR